MFKDTTFDTENSPIAVGETTIVVFNKVTVCIEVEQDRNIQQGKLRMTLVHPIDSAVSSLSFLRGVQ